MALQTRERRQNSNLVWLSGACPEGLISRLERRHTFLLLTRARQAWLKAGPKEQVRIERTVEAAEGQSKGERRNTEVVRVLLEKKRKGDGDVIRRELKSLAVTQVSPGLFFSH